MGTKSRKRHRAEGSHRAKEGRERELAELVTQQHGVVGRRQLLALGFGEGTMRRWVRSRRLHRLHREAFAYGHARIGQRGYWLAAVLACSEGAVLSHRSAAQLWGLARPRRGNSGGFAPGREG